MDPIMLEEVAPSRRVPCSNVPKSYAIRFSTEPLLAARERISPLIGA